MIFGIPSPPSWTDILTGIGTVTLAAGTLATLIFTVWVTRQDRARAQQQLTDDRANAAALLHEQLQHSEQLARDERENYRQQQLEAEAWSVQVMLTDFFSHQDMRQMTATVTNYGHHTVAKLRGRFLKDDGLPLDVASTDLISRAPFERSTSVMHPDMDKIRSPQVVPAGAGVRIRSAEAPDAELTSPNVKVRWRDYAGHEWEHDHANGEVRNLTDTEAADW